MNNLNVWKQVAVLKGDGSQITDNNRYGLGGPPASEGQNLKNQQYQQQPASQTARYIKLGTISQPRDVPWH